MANDYMAKLAAELEGNRMDDLASMGRFGDTIVAHINPQEAQMLMEEGGSGTINPMTGLPEFFWSADTSADEEGEAGDEGAADYSFDEAMETATQAMADMAAAEEAKQAATEVADNRGISDTPGFSDRLNNSIAGKTQNEKGENIGLTQDEIAELSFYTDNPKDSRFGSYLGYNELVSINAPQSREEENARLDEEYTDRLNQEFKYKGLDARIAPDPSMKDNYVYTGPDATQAFLGELGSGIYNAVGGFGAMMLDSLQMTPGGLVTGALFGRDLLAPQFFEDKTIAGPGKYIGEKLGLVDKEGKAPFEGFLDSLTSSIKSGLGIGTDKQIEQTVLKNNPDKITVSKEGKLVSVSKDGEERNLSGVLSPPEVMESIIGKPPTDAEFKAITSGGSPSEYDLMFGKNTSLLGPDVSQMRVTRTSGRPGDTALTAIRGERGRSGDIIDYEKAMGGLGKEPSLEILEDVIGVTPSGIEVTEIRGAPQITAQENVMRAGPVTDIDNLNFLDLDAARIAEAKDVREGMASGMPGPRSIDRTSLNYPAYDDLAKARAETNLSSTASTASTATTPSIAFVDSDPFEYGGNEPIVRRKPRPVVSQAIDEAVEEDKPYFPEVRLPRLTESGLKTLQYTLRNDPEALQNIYNTYALPEQYSGLKALV